MCDGEGLAFHLDDEATVGTGDLGYFADQSPEQVAGRYGRAYRLVDRVERLGAARRRALDLEQACILQGERDRRCEPAREPHLAFVEGDSAGPSVEEQCADHHRKQDH